MAWKKTMQVFQTAGVPPREGRIILAIMGWTRKSSVALTNRVMAKSNGKGVPPLGTVSSASDKLSGEHAILAAAASASRADSWRTPQEEPPCPRRDADK